MRGHDVVEIPLVLRKLWPYQYGILTAVNIPEITLTLHCYFQSVSLSSQGGDRRLKEGALESKGVQCHGMSL